MREAYMQLHTANRDLVKAHTIRSNNHQELLASLKSLNQLIQNAARLQGLLHLVLLIVSLLYHYALR